MHTRLSGLQAPQRVGFRALVVSPTRELAQQTYREFTRLSVGSGFKVHVLTKAKANANSFGPQSSRRFGELCVHFPVFKYSVLTHIHL